MHARHKVEIWLWPHDDTRRGQVPGERHRDSKTERRETIYFKYFIK